VRPKLAMIGLDAAELSFVRAAGASLPALRRALETGLVRRLRSPADLLPGSVWPTFFTGKPPGEHGFYHHLQWDPAAMRLRRVAEDWLPCEPFWCALERRGARVVVVDVPMTFRSRLARGVEVTTWGAHDQLTPFSTRPTSLAREIRRRFGTHPMGYEIPVSKSRRERERIRAALVEGARRKGELSLWLAARADWDLFITVFGECHRGGHILWPESADDDALLDVYRAVDAAVGRLLDALPRDATVVLFSLHGMGPNTSQEHFVPSVMDRLNARFHGHAAPRPAGLVRRLREVVPARVQDAVARAVPVAARDFVVDRSISAGHDWRRTLGFDVLSDLNGYLRFNVRGRERRGALDPGSELFPRYADWVRACFAELHAEPGGSPLVRDVLFARDVFRGPRAHYLPDMIVTWTGAPPAERVRSERLGTFTAGLTTGRSGNHRRDGFSVVMEPGARGAEAEAPPGEIVDLAPLAARALAGMPA
jgi:predicted AlkP superfamily phosphohydrolase/phosphomutase